MVRAARALTWIPINVERRHEPVTGVTEAGSASLFDEIEYEANRLYVGGQWVSTDSIERINVISPVTEQVIGSVPAPTGADADRAVIAARRSFDAGSWR